MPMNRRSWLTDLAGLGLAGMVAVYALIVALLVRARSEFSLG